MSSPAAPPPALAPFASILHRGTIEALVGTRTYERGVACLRGGRVVDVTVSGGQLRGSVRPSEASRPMYAIRIWAKDDGLAYSCNCPVGVERRFCKHGVAVALAHMDSERALFCDRVAILRRALVSISPQVLADRLAAAAREDLRLQALLAEICVELLT